MMVIVVYDIETQTAAGKKRLKKIAGVCRNWGIPVQNSVYECEVDAEKYRAMKRELSELIDPSVDSVRIYALGHRYRSRMERLGAQKRNWDWETFVI